MGWGSSPTGHCDLTRRGPILGSTARRTISSVFLVLTSVLLSSCGEEPRLAPPVDPSPVADMALPTTPRLATPANTIASPRIGEIVWTAATDPISNVPIEPVTSYRSDATRIIAAAPILALPAGSRIEATWEYNNTSLDPFTTQLVTPKPVEETWITLHIDRDPEVLWPEGQYGITISLDGVAIQQGAVEVLGQA